MSLTLSLHTAPEVPVEADVLCPDRLNNLNESALSALPVFHGNIKAKIGDFFTVQGKYNGEMRIEGNLTKVKHIGAGMTSGRLIVCGNTGLHLGACMQGGEIIVEGSVGDWAASEMTGDGARQSGRRRIPRAPYQPSARDVVRPSSSPAS